MRTPHIQWCHIDLIPRMNRIETIHIVPVMSKFETEPDMARGSQWRVLEPRKYDSRFFEARF